jgi:hypothetical protein
VSREWGTGYRGTQLRRWIRAPGQAGFLRGSVLYKKGLHHVVYTLVSAVDNALSDSVAAPSIKTHPHAALGAAAIGSDGGPEAAGSATGKEAAGEPTPAASNPLSAPASRIARK